MEIRKPTNLVLLLVLLGDLLLHLLLGLGLLLLEISQKFGEEAWALGPVLLLSGSLGLKKGISDNHALNEVATCRLVTLFGTILGGLASRSGLSGRRLSGLVSNRRSLNEKMTRE